MNSKQIIGTLFTLFFLGISSLANAQKNQGLDNRLLIKYSPLALAELETVVFQGGVEYFLNDSLSWQGEIGLNSGVFGANAGRDQNSDFSFIRFRTEVKWYLASSYVAAEVFVLAKDFDRQNDFFFNGENNFSYDRSNIRYFSTGAMAKIGSQKFIGKRVLFDKYIGLGFRVNHNEVNVLEGGAIGGDGPSPILEDKYRSLGWALAPNLTVGFKIAFLTGTK
ncbi:hypothetical protein [Algoriphagus antarcticus]|uniref:Outer membrane protein with beta-barrel domain n=1 Tax=Algoriphagus antarcticus TaxID=238540 RepID=A0A3E0DP59_9BACT|nr:hypothetical protein [Algoriphagus antarcticus]REG84737.1 hypothetical protein C8N25_11486 [Algoriphagus antarcticus]